MVRHSRVIFTPRGLPPSPVHPTAARRRAAEQRQLRLVVEMLFKLRSETVWADTKLDPCSPPPISYSSPSSSSSHQRTLSWSSAMRGCPALPPGTWRFAMAEHPSAPTTEHGWGNNPTPQPCIPFPRAHHRRASPAGTTALTVGTPLRQVASHAHRAET